jgi:hypothetical protein
MRARSPRTLVAALAVAALAVALVFLQRLYDARDRAAAIALVTTPAPDGGWSIARELSFRRDGQAPSCRAKQGVSPKGRFEVTCDAAEAEPYRFAVDPVRQAVLPADDRTHLLTDLVHQKARGLLPPEAKEPLPGSGPIHVQLDGG